MNFKAFNQTKEKISKIIQCIEEDRQKFETTHESRSQYVSILEFKLLQRFEGIIVERKEIKKRLFNQIDDRYNILRKKLIKEERNRNESVDNF